MGDQQFLLNLVDFVVIDHSVQLLVVAVVHLLEEAQHPADVNVVRVVA